jgi:hypothetical protein
MTTRALASRFAFFALVCAATAWSMDAHAAPAAETSIVYASVTCAPATKPGRIRCRAALELPLDTTTARKLAWGELVIVAAGSGVVPLRGRLGVLDAETRDDQRITWSFSVAAAEVGERPLDVVLRGTVEERATGTPTPVERLVHATIKVAP